MKGTRGDEIDRVCDLCEETEKERMAGNQIREQDVPLSCATSLKSVAWISAAIPTSARLRASLDEANNIFCFTLESSGDLLEGRSARDQYEGAVNAAPHDQSHPQDAFRRKDLRQSCRSTNGNESIEQAGS